MMLILCVCIILFFLIILPYIDYYYNNNINNICNNIEKLTPNFIDTKICSKSCCNQNQWPVSFLGKDAPNNNYISNNYSCNFQDSSGCPCLTNNDYNYLTNKGGNN